MAVVLKMRLLAALLSCMLTRSLRQKVMLPLSAHHGGQSHQAGQQYARLDEALATDSNRAAAATMAATAESDPAVLRYDVYDDMLVLSSGERMASGFIYLYIVFATEAAMKAWTPGGDFTPKIKGGEMMLPPGVDTQTHDDGRKPSPWFFWATVQASDFEALKNAFHGIAVATRAEAGTVRYDQACGLSDSGGFCFENVWYDETMLPNAQLDHNSAPHMQAFFGAISTITIQWAALTMQINQPGISGGSISYIKVIGGSAENADLVAKLAKVPECNYQGLLPASDPNTDTFKVVDMKCCDLATWTDVGLVQGDDKDVTFTQWDKKKDGVGEDYTCVVADLGNLGGFPSWIRGYQGCESKKVVYAESCVPTAQQVEHGWPMTAEVAAKYWEQGTHESCHCEERKLIGDQCFVGQTFEGFAFFGKSIGDVDCGGVASNLPTEPPNEDSAFGTRLGAVVMTAISVALFGLSPCA